MGTVLTMMGLFSLLVLMSAAACSVDHVHADLQISEVQVSWLTKFSMEIEIGMNGTDTILLTPASNIPGMETPCLFSGQLLRDPRSVVAVSGCLGDEETSLSIASTLLPGGIVDISIVDGVAYQVTADEAVDVEDYVVLTQERRKRGLEESSPRARSRTRSRSRTRDRFRSDDYEEYDYEVDDFVIPPPTRDRKRVPVISGPLPKKVVLETDIKYDNSLLDHFTTHTKAKEWISRVVELSKPWMSHKSLAMPITLKTRKIDHTDQSLKASEKALFFLTSTYSPRSLTSYFCEDILGESNLRGYAWGGSACRTDGYAVNINELFTTSNSELRTAKNFAHELGHNIGMKHDFADDHGGKTGPCNKQGLMSYGKKRPDKWSECSNKDFTDWWRREGHECVKESSETNIAGSTVVPIECPAGWTLYYGNNKCLRYYGIKGTWNDADALCKGKSSIRLIGHLASIHSSEEFNFTKTLFGDIRGYAWIGGTKGSSQWRWTDDTTWDYENWQDGEPNNRQGDEYCLEWNSGRDYRRLGLNDLPCDWFRTALCQLKPVQA